MILKNKVDQQGTHMLFCSYGFPVVTTALNTDTLFRYNVDLAVIGFMQKADCLSYTYTYAVGSLPYICPVQGPPL